MELEDQGIAEINIPVMQPCKPIEILGGQFRHYCYTFKNEYRTPTQEFALVLDNGETKKIYLSAYECFSSIDTKSTCISVCELDAMCGTTSTTL